MTRAARQNNKASDRSSSRLGEVFEPRLPYRITKSGKSKPTPPSMPHSGVDKTGADQVCGKPSVVLVTATRTTVDRKMGVTLLLGRLHSSLGNEFVIKIAPENQLGEVKRDRRVPPAQLKESCVLGHRLNGSGCPKQCELNELA